MKPNIYDFELCELENILCIIKTSHIDIDCSLKEAIKKLESRLAYMINNYVEHTKESNYDRD